LPYIAHPTGQKHLKIFLAVFAKFLVARFGSPVCLFIFLPTRAYDRGTVHFVITLQP
jgi:hypothetical protein